VVSSPLSRAKQTAQAIAEALGIPEIGEEALLIERDMGDMSGVAILYPDALPANMESWEGIARARPCGAASLRQGLCGAGCRCGDAWRFNSGGDCRVCAIEAAGKAVAFGECMYQFVYL